MDGKVEHVPLPVVTYHALRHQITEQLKHPQENEDYQVFAPADYIDNPVALARIHAGITKDVLRRPTSVKLKTKKKLRLK